MEQCDGHPAKISCVILNYNDEETVTNLVQLIHDYDYLESIVVVDNASTDDSYDTLLVLQDEKVSVIQTGKNGGYGAGNNAGVRYATEVLGATHVLIANPDVVFSEQCVMKMARMFTKHPDTGVVAACMQDETYGTGGSNYNGWKLRSFTGELLAMGPISRRIFGKFLNYPESYFQNKKAVYVDAVHGSMLMVDGAAFRECGGYDENIFLYQEEAVLGWRMKTAGYRTVLLLTEEYQHQHSASISRSYEKLIERQKLRNESVLYYMKHYLYINPVQEWIAKLWFAMILLEDRVAALILKDAEAEGEE